MGHCTLFLGIVNPNRSILFPDVNRRPEIISTLRTFTSRFGRNVMAFCRSDEANTGSEVKDGVGVR